MFGDGRLGPALSPAAKTNDPASSSRSQEDLEQVEYSGSEDLLPGQYRIGAATSANLSFPRQE